MKTMKIEKGAPRSFLSMAKSQTMFSEEDQKFQQDEEIMRQKYSSIETYSSKNSDELQNNVKPRVQDVKKEKERQRLSHDLQSIKQEKEKIQLEKDKLMFKVSTMSRQHARMKLSVYEIKKELRETQYFLQQAKDDKQSAFKTISDKNQTIKQLNQKIKQLSLQINDKNGVQILIDDLKAKNIKLQGDLQHQYRQLNSSITKNQQLQLEIEKQKSSNKQLSEHIQSLSNAVKKYQTGYKALQNQIEKQRISRSQNINKEARLSHHKHFIQQAIQRLRQQQLDIKAHMHLEKTQMINLVHMIKKQVEQRNQLVQQQTNKELNIMNSDLFSEEEKKEEYDKKISSLQNFISQIEHDLIQTKLLLADQININTQLQKQVLDLKR